MAGLGGSRAEFRLRGCVAELGGSIAGLWGSGAGLGVSRA
jgi:hypothetical protein